MAAPSHSSRRPWNLSKRKTEDEKQRRPGRNKRRNSQAYKRGRRGHHQLQTVWKDQHQTAFLEAHSKEEIVDMLRRNTYHEELAMAKGNAAGSCPHSSAWAGGEFRPRFTEEELFDKVLTPSDVAKLNRLMIPKHHAESCFPQLLNGRSDSLLISFVDGGGQVWRIKYSFWSSSHSYVLTRGWRVFLRRMGSRQEI